MAAIVISARAALLLFLLLTTVGCQGLGTYTSHLASDFGDCVRARAAAATGLYAEVEVTAGLHPSVGFADVTLAPRYSLEWDPSGSASGELRTAAFPSLLVAWPWYGAQETADGYGETSPYVRGLVAPYILMGNRQVGRRSNSLFGLHHFIPNPRLVDPELSEMNVPPPPRRATDDYWVGVSVTVLVGRVDFGINIVEIWDLLFGVFGFDLLDDNATEPPEAMPPREASTGEPGE